MRRLSLNAEFVARAVEWSHLPEKTVRSCVEGYLAAVLERTLQGYDASPLPIDVIGLDHLVALYPGWCIVSGHEDSGKTSLALAIARGLSSIRTVVVIDGEGKLVHHLHHLTPACVVVPPEMDVVGELVRSGLVDVVVVDTITSIAQQRSLLSMLSQFVPYVILVSQMRVDLDSGRMVVAGTDIMKSRTYMQIMVMGGENVTIEGESVRRVQFVVDKYEPDRRREGQRGCFVIRNNGHDRLYTAYDIIKSRGLVDAVGRHKFIGDTDIGLLRDVRTDEEMISSLSTMARNELRREDGNGTVYGVQDTGEADR